MQERDIFVKCWSAVGFLESGGDADGTRGSEILFLSLLLLREIHLRAVSSLCRDSKNVTSVPTASQMSLQSHLLRKTREDPHPVLS